MPALTARPAADRRIALRPFRIVDATPRMADVLRVEHVESWIGPYQHERGDVEDIMRLVDGNGLGTHQPTAMLDIPGIMPWLGRLNVLDGHDPFISEVLGMYEMSQLRFGFLHMAQLRAWFGDSFLPLAQAGYVVGRYRVRDPGIIRGHNQVAFHLGYAERAGTLAFTEAMTNVPVLPPARAA